MTVFLVSITIKLFVYNAQANHTFSRFFQLCKFDEPAARQEKAF